MSSVAAKPARRAHAQAEEPSRLSAANSSFRSDRKESASRATPPRQPKMTASSSSSSSAKTRTLEERRHDEHRISERTYEVQVERRLTRTTSPDKAQRRTAEKSTERRPKEPAAEAADVPWAPQVRLLPHTSAPLASRTSFPPVASASCQAPQPVPLSELRLEAQEAAMVEDLLFVLMGYEGQYIRFAKGYNPSEERDRLSGPNFRPLPGLDPSLHDLIQTMLKMAKHYSALAAFVDVQGRDEFGAVNHALCASIRRFLHDYLVMVAQLETEFLTSDAFTVHVLNLHTVPTGLMMQQLYSLAQELLKKNALLDEESDEDGGQGGDESEDDYDNIIERLTDGGSLLPGNMTGKRICKGGVVLGIVTKRLEAMSGDPAARTLLTSLLRDASRPYMTMLNEWLHHGGISDPHAEFLIKEQKSIRRDRLEQDYTDEYWERRYTIRDRDVPPQLQAVKDKVLLAGKYLNVVRECGGVDVSKEVTDVPTSFDDGRFLENVNNAYAHANESLMRLLLTTHALPARLRSMKHYFFLDPSDYFSYFLELGASELRKPVRSVNTGKLQSLLDLVLRQPGSVVSLDPFKEDVKVEMNEVTLVKSLQRVVNITGIEQGDALQPPLSAAAAATTTTTAPSSGQPTEGDKNATGFTSLQLDYAVPFPVSLVISRKTVWRYQALFRYLLSLRHLESQLSTTWQTQTRGIGWAHRGPDTALELWKRRAWTLRARMLVFVQQLLYFCTAEVIEPNWSRFMARVRAAGGAAEAPSAPDPDKETEQPESATAARRTRTVDELMQDHVDFLDTCLKECMLTNSKLLRVRKPQPFPPHPPSASCSPPPPPWRNCSRARLTSTCESRSTPS